MRHQSNQSLTATILLVVLLNGGGEGASRAATSARDAALTRITKGSIVEDKASSQGCAWGDYDGDGFLDLLVSNFNGAHFLYHNSGGRDFSRAFPSPLAMTPGSAYAGAWGDFDNDGLLDLIVPDFGGIVYLYRNEGSGSFVPISSTGLKVGESTGVAWSDYDGDGYLDLFLANHMESNLLFHNDSGTGAFRQITMGNIVTDVGHALATAWADYNNDGAPDLVVFNHEFENFLYRNDRNGSFERVTGGSLSSEVVDAHGGAWGDFDNDGFIDLFAANAGGNNLVYRNNRDGTFTKITDSVVAREGGKSQSATWADYDNDGWLDLFVSNIGQTNFLYRNNRDGTFTKISSGSIVNDRGNSQGCAWGDYDRDGFPDLFVANTGGNGNFLYHNDGNSNNWITIRCVGAASNRASIGARVEVQAVIDGKALGQMREISGGGAYGGQNGLEAAFGLGDATKVDLVRVEWPSGIVQELRDVKPRQFLTVTEPPRLEALATAAGWPRLFLVGGVGRRYLIERSVDLANWSAVATVTNTSRRTAWIDAGATNFNRAFYRATGNQDQ